jgi:hypothetical protein
MSDERFEELAIPRRKFLKGIVGGAFAAPVVVSFALDGVAEAKGPQFPNQVFDHLPNQFFEHNPFYRL